MSHNRQSHVRILLADDHPMLRQALRTLLQSEPDFEVVAEADNGNDALKLTLSTSPDVVLTDLRIPGLNGIELTRQIREQAPDIVVVGLSIHDDMYLAQRMYDAGAFAYLDKAGDVSLIFDSLRQAARHAGADNNITNYLHSGSAQPAPSASLS